MRTPLVVANWKMNGSRKLCEGYSKALLNIPDIDIWLAPPFVYLTDIVHDRRLQKVVACGAQNVHEEVEGAFTGEVSASMVAELGASFAIIGHSERRAQYSENDTIISRKLQSCVNAKIISVLCVGESLRQRQDGTAQSVVQTQLQTVRNIIQTTGPDQVVVAYEPIWAIGTGVSASPQDVEEMHRSIREFFGSEGTKLRILYGGSVKPNNAEELIRQSNIDGFLVGGASLNPSSFTAICQLVSGK